MTKFNLFVIMFIVNQSNYIMKVGYIMKLQELINQIPELSNMVIDGYSNSEIKEQAKFMLEAIDYDGFYSDMESSEIRILKQIIKLIK